jgi:hypothetical protein
MQDRERAYFDSADWVLGMVLNKILILIFRHATSSDCI